MILPVLIASLTGCSVFDEGLVIEDIVGRVYLPKEAAQRSIFNTQPGPDGLLNTADDIVEETMIDDVRLIGPVYLGLYSGVSEADENFPHPLRGPKLEGDQPGDTYPYGATTVGDIRFACFEYLTCKVVSGRYVDFDGLVSWFTEELGQGFTDQFGNPVTNGDFVRQTCYDFLNVTSDEEIRVTATDTNNDGKVDEKDLDFVWDPDAGDEGAWVADFTFWQQEFFQDPEAKPGTSGFTLYGWMDAPSERGYNYTTCDSGQGQQNAEYANDFRGGSQQRDTMNDPASYIAVDDYVSCGDRPMSEIKDAGEECVGTIITDPKSTEIEIWLDWRVQ